MDGKKLTIDKDYMCTECAPNAAVVFGYQISPEVYNRISSPMKKVLEKRGLKHKYRPKTELLQDEGGEMVLVDSNPPVILGIEILSTRDATSINNKTLEEKLNTAFKGVEGMKKLIAGYQRSMKKDPEIYLLSQSRENRDYRLLTS